jgi:phage portal protein BeeE
MKILGTAIRGARTETRRAQNNVNLVGAPSFATTNPYGLYNHYASDEYASAYPNIRAITNEFMKIMPYAIDGNGKPVKQHAVIDALYHPNRKDSSVLFREKLAVSVLALPMTYLLVWRNEGNEAKPGGPFTAKGQNIAGFTFLENPAMSYRDGIIYYSVGSQEFTENEVIAIPGGATPDNLYAGYSPTIAAARWATLDSYIADFQKGFFENNAIPAGMFKVVAATKTEYDDAVDKLQERHRGAGNNNNLTYSHVPLNQEGKPAQSQVEWIPFAQTNKDIDFKPLLEHINNRLSEAYGVSAIIKGVDSQATYNNAEVSENGFAKRAVDPLPLRIYTQITHELNRMTGGLGVAITYKFDIPAISDAEKVKAETKILESNLIKTMVEAGYSLDTIVDAFELSVGYKNLKIGNQPAVIKNDKPDVDEGKEVDGSPDPTKIDGVTPLNKKAPVLASSEYFAHGGSEHANPKAETDEQKQLEAVARAYMKSQIDRTVANLPDGEPNNAVEDPTIDEQEQFVEDMQVIIVAIMIKEGSVEYDAGKKMLAEAGISTENLDEFILNDVAQDAYRAYLKRVGQSYGEDTANAIRSVLQQATAEGLTRKETEKALKNILTTDEWRVKRIGVTELNRSQSLSGVEAMKQIQAESGAVIEKSLYHPLGAECEYCKALEGKWKAVDQDYIPLYGIVQGVDGGILVNDFVSNEGYDPHPNGKGVMTYRVVDSTVSNLISREIHCSVCDRFMGQTNAESLDAKIKCPNSKCKALEIPIIKEIK